MTQERIQPSIQESSGYSKLRFLRIVAAWFLFLAGWLVWWLGMLAPKIWGSSSAWVDSFTDPASYMIGCFVFGLAHLYKLLHPSTSGDSVSPVVVLFIPYLLMLFGLWWPVLMRSWWLPLWIWRVGALFMLSPWQAVHWVYFERGGQPLHPGMLLWAIGSTLLGMAVWISPAKLWGEPVSAVTVLVRAWKKEPILEQHRKQVIHAFPVTNLDL